MRRIVPIIIVLALLAWAATAAFQVDETEFAIVTQFGSPQRTLLDAGLNFKLPLPVQAVRRFDNRVQVFETPGAGRTNDEFLTRDKKNVVVGTYTVWRISREAASVTRFMQSAGDIQGGQERLTDLVVAELGACLGRNDFSTLVTTDAAQWKWRELLAEITSRCRDRAKSDYGVEILDIQIQRLSFPDQNRRSVFERMRAERERMASQYRSEGEEQAIRIRAQARSEETRILAEADEQARRTRGEADANATRIYGDAYGRAPEFYEFLRTLESYGKALDQNTVLVLSGEGRYLRWLNPAASQPAPGDERGQSPP